VTDAWIRTSGKLAVRSCPSCRRRLDAVTTATVGRKPTTTPLPKPGDITICGYCGAALVMTLDAFRIATQDEVDALPELTKALARGWPTRRRDGA
jgi:hypothetical protein